MVKKKPTDKSNDNLRQKNSLGNLQESRKSKINRPIKTAEQQQASQTSRVTSGNDSKGKLEKSDSSVNKSRLKLFVKEVGKGTLRTSTNAVKNGAHKYQKELEKGDDGVKVASQGTTVAAKGTIRVLKTSGKFVKSIMKISAKKHEGEKFIKAKENPLPSTSKIKLKLQKNPRTNFVKAKGNPLTSKSKMKLSAGKLKSKKNIKTKGNPLPSKSIRKLREKKLESKKFIKAKENPLTKEKNVSTLKKIAVAPALALKNSAKKTVVKGVKSYQKELEQGDEGVKLVSQGATQIAKTSKKLTKGIIKINSLSSKLGKQNGKLKKILNKGKPLKTQSKAALKKKAFKKKMYAPQRQKLRKRAFTGAMSSFSGRMSAMFKGLGKININTIKNAIGAKIAAIAAAGLMSILPYILGVVIVLIAIAGILGATSSQQQAQLGSSRNLSPEVEQWRSLVEIEAAAQGMEAYISLILAIIQVESGGKGTRDIMQSSESAGYPRNYFQTEEESVRQGIKHLKNIVDIVRPYGLENDFRLLAQAYNFGSAFGGYVGRRGGDYNLDVAEQYSREVVAPSLGNFIGETYPYNNSTSQRLGKPYLYRNGGNYMYGELVAEYMGGAGVTGDFLVVVNELEKYLGSEYVWGGKNPSTGFDCSGFVSWGLAQIGITLPSYAASQYDLTVEIDPSEAQPGDLIFFKGTYGGANHVSHVGFYIDDTTMLDSNGSGVGYHNWKDPYWQKHYAGIRRVVN